MTTPYAALGQLRACLAGSPPEPVDWIAVVKLANEALLTPQLAAALAAAPRLPDDVRAFLADVRSRNAERNRRLFDQLTEAVGVLNRAGIEPTLLKGAALWVSGPVDAPFERLLADIDLMVRPDEARRALAALTLHGFVVLAEHEGHEVHAFAELARPQDVGAIDLHQRPPGPPGLAESSDFARHRRTIAWNGVSAQVPSPAMSVFLTILHDQFHDGDYWRGGFDLRHLHDIAALAARPEGVDWDEVMALCGTGLARNAAATELLAARRLMGATVPRDLTRRPMVRFQHARRVGQFRWPALRPLLAAVGVLAEVPNLLAHGAENRRGRGRVLGPALAQAQSSPGDRAERLRHIFARPEAGKI